MPSQRQLRVRRLANPNFHSGPVTRCRRRRQSTPEPLDVNAAATTPTATREISTEPASPISPTLCTKAYSRALRRQRSAHFVQAVLHYDRSENDLQPWYWPVNDAGERVTPCNLLEYRLSHDFQAPCCLCASLNQDETSYTESAIFLATSGPSAGKYIAACATGQCRYWVCLEHLYHQRGLLVRRYSLRGDAANIVPAPATPQSQSSASRMLQEVEQYIGSVMDMVVQGPQPSAVHSHIQQPLPEPEPFAPATTAGIPAFTPDSKTESCFGLLLQLDDITEPGLSESAFQDLFSQCRRCRKYMTRRTTMFHDCKGPTITEIIDLTNEY